MDATRKSPAQGEIIMNYSDLERKIIAARPHTSAANRRFTDAVMANITTPEIFTHQIRSMNVTNKETFMMKLKHLPKLAVVAIALGALLIISGTAYATYQLLWTKPSVTLDHLTTSPSGREEALLITKDCGSFTAQRYELKKNATITADRIPAIVQAQCELRAIDTWAQDIYGQSHMPDVDGSASYTYTHAMVSMATHLQRAQGDEVTFAAYDKYGIPAVTLKTSPSVTYIVNGKEANASALHEGDVVAYVTTSTIVMTKNENGGYSGSGMPEHTLVAIVKLSMPFADYDQFAWQSLSERQTCYGNPTEHCIAGSASIDLYMGGTPALSEGTIMKELQGVVTAIDGATVSLKGSSGTVYHVTTPTDVIKSYNDTKASQYYNNQKVTIGSSISVNYSEREDAHSTTINAAYMRFMIELVSKGDPVKAY